MIIDNYSPKKVHYISVFVVFVVFLSSQSFQSGAK